MMFRSINKHWIILQNKSLSLIDPFSLYTNNIFEIYKSTNNYFDKLLKLFYRFFRKIHIIKEIPKSLEYNKEWIKKIKQINNWILFFDNNSKDLCKYIKQKNPFAHVFVFSWDINFTPSNEICFDGVGTFDYLQAKNNNINYYSQFYAYKKESLSLIHEQKTKYKFCFLGHQKSRIELINQIKSLCDEISGQSYWKIVKNEKDTIPYINYLSTLINSDCIVDIVVPEQSGLSLRPMEALFFNKKLITNNTYIKNCDFYNPNNIFIYGIDKDLNNFMALPLIKIEDVVKKNYTIEEWVLKIIT